MGYMYGSGWEKLGWMLLKLVGFILASFVFSFIFWATKKWMDQTPVKKKKK
jgi:hypothetical protein